MEPAASNLPVSHAQRYLFCRMLEIDVDPEMAKRIMSFWIFLESKGFKNIHEHIIYAMNSDVFRCVCAEAEMALAFLDSQGDSVRMTTSSISCPITWSFAGSFLPCFLGDKAQVANDILAIQNSVCDVAFQHILEKKLGKQVIKTSDEGGSQKMKTHASNLNPHAQEWKPVPEDERSLFMTFSRGHPLAKTEIVNYFRRKYGNCVQDCFVFKPRDRQPEFGKIVFKFSYMLNMILNNRESAMIYIGCKTLCLKKYRLAA